MLTWKVFTTTSHAVHTRLRHSPESGRHIPEFPYLPHRELIVDNYRVIYRYAADRGMVLITTVVHGRRLQIEPLITEEG
ncbi:MAG: type II toxin-antitoxin system RelE/ParE family toxin [Nitrospirae bacterium]|nr:type II toxin-antitoxin system RelE/ParE family toxin [Nitrospirota bacterium]